jgi:transcriptional regulator with XRE-family HTH domain
MFHLELLVCLAQKNADTSRLAMPRLIIQRSGRRKIPPCGRLIEYKEPHSPFQKLIDSQRRRYGFSGRDLAERIGVSQSTLWIWLHSLNGFPHPKSFNHRHLDRLSRVLKTPADKIKRALDASRHLFTPTENPMPHDAFDALGRLIEILENDRRHTISRSYVLNIAKNLYRGAK